MGRWITAAVALLAAAVIACGGEAEPTEIVWPTEEPRPVVTNTPEPTEPADAGAEQAENVSPTLTGITLGYAAQHPGEELPRITFETGRPFQIRVFARYEDNTHGPLPFGGDLTLKVLLSGPTGMVLHPGNILTSAQDTEGLLTATFGPHSTAATARAQRRESKTSDDMDGIEITPLRTTLYFSGETSALELKATFKDGSTGPLPHDLQNPPLLFSDNPRSATVDNSGNLQAVGPGTARISARSGRHEAELTALVTVMGPEAGGGSSCTAPNPAGQGNDYLANRVDLTMLPGNSTPEKAAAVAATRNGEIITGRTPSGAYRVQLDCPPGDAQDRAASLNAAISAMMQMEGVSHILPVEAVKTEGNAQGQRPEEETLPHTAPAPPKPESRPGDEIVRIMPEPAHTTLAPGDSFSLGSIKLYNQDGTVSEVESNASGITYTTGHMRRAGLTGRLLSNLLVTADGNILALPDSPTTTIVLTATYLEHQAHVRIDIRANAPDLGPGRDECTPGTGSQGHILAEMSGVVALEDVADTVNGLPVRYFPAFNGHVVRVTCADSEALNTLADQLARSDWVNTAHAYVPTTGDAWAILERPHAGPMDQTVTLEAGQQYQLAIRDGLYSNGAVGPLTTEEASGLGYRSRNEGIAAVTPLTGLVTANETGTASITVAGRSGDAAIITVNVIPPDRTQGSQNTLRNLTVTPAGENVLLHPNEATQLTAVAIMADGQEKNIEPGDPAAKWSSSTLEIDERGVTQAQGFDRPTHRLTLTYGGRTAHKTAVVRLRDDLAPEVDADCRFNPEDGEPYTASTVRITTGPATGRNEALRMAERTRTTLWGTTPRRELLFTYQCSSPEDLKENYRRLMLEEKTIRITLHRPQEPAGNPAGITVHRPEKPIAPGQNRAIDMEFHYPDGSTRTLSPAQRRATEFKTADGVTLAASGDGTVTGLRPGETTLEAVHALGSGQTEITVAPVPLDNSCRHWTIARDGGGRFEGQWATLNRIRFIATAGTTDEQAETMAQMAGAHLLPDRSGLPSVPTRTAVLELPCGDAFTTKVQDVERALNALELIGTDSRTAKAWQETGKVTVTVEPDYTPDLRAGIADPFPGTETDCSRDPDNPAVAAGQTVLVAAGGVTTAEANAIAARAGGVITKNALDGKTHLIAHGCTIPGTSSWASRNLTGYPSIEAAHPRPVQDSP